MISVKKVPCHPVSQNTAKFNPSIPTYFYFFFVENQNSDKSSENEKVVKATEELALFQLHHYTSFNLAYSTDVPFLRFSGEQRQARIDEIREKIAPVLQAKLNEV